MRYFYHVIRLLISLLFLLLVQSAAAQMPVLGWAGRFNVYDNYHSVDARAVAVDSQGNVFTAGILRSQTDFDPGPGVYNLVPAGPLQTGVYITKLGAQGQFLWALQLPIYTNTLLPMRVDRQGNLFLMIELEHAADMDPGPGVYNVTPMGRTDLVLIKLNTSGQLQWIKQLGGAGSDTQAECYSMVIDRSDNLVFAGWFRGPVDFNPGAAVDTLGVSGGFICKLTTAGNLVLARNMGGVAMWELDCDRSGNIYCTGMFGRFVDFDPGPGIYNLDVDIYGAVFVAKYDGSGNFIWAGKVGDAAYVDLRPAGIGVDSHGNVYTLGQFQGLQDFDPGPGIHNVQSNMGTIDTYLLKLDAQGVFAWVRTVGGASEDFAYDLAMGSDDKIYTAGTYNDLVDLDPGPPVNLQNHRDLMVFAKWEGNGTLAAAVPFLPAPDGGGIPARVTIGAQQEIYGIGLMSGGMDFDPGPGIFAPDPDVDGGSAFVFKLTRCTNVTQSGLTVSSCQPYTLNSQTYDSSGTYMQTISNTAGCDSVITLQLTINRRATAQTKHICAGQSFFVGGALQTVAGAYVDTLQTVLGCDSIVTTQLIVDTAPSVNFGPDRDLCANAPLTLSPGSFAAYLWQNGSAAATQTIDAPGLYWVTVQNAGGCSASDSIRILTVHLAPEPSLGADRSLCANAAQTLSPGSFAQYTWQDGSTQSTLGVSDAGLYWVTVQNGAGCSAIDSLRILSVHPAPAPNLGPDRDGCAGVPRVLDPGVFTSYAWQDGSTQSNFVPDIPGLYWVTVQNQWGCAATDSIRIPAFRQPPSGFLPALDSVCTFESLELRPTTGFAQYLWSTTATGSSILVGTPGTYWLRVTDAAGCTGVDSVRIIARECSKSIFFPTAFTPNGDGRNDRFGALLSGPVRSFRLLVFDRWGNVVFATTDPAMKWNGTYRGLAYTVSTTFAWQCTYQFEGEAAASQKGTMTLLR
ncbi:MAG: T9SS type B sorting domain-containing protein [Chitinophagaceae bacterium]|nr:MAG: T9SS type B sorting domain-containing protein [Chitinophagaceae bacterium]